MEVILEFVGEVLLQFVLEVLAELGWRSVKDTVGGQPRSVFAAFGHMVLGLIAGGISLWLSPHLMIKGFGAQVANLVLAPIAVGLSMAALGAWRRRRGQAVLQLDRFAYAYLFALSTAAVRFAFGM